MSLTHSRIIVITGAKGFIGSVLTANALATGWQVIALDDCSRGLNSVEALLATSANKHRGKFIKHDCREGLEPIFDEYAQISGWGLERTKAGFPVVDAVVHLAAGTGSLSRPYEELVEFIVEMTQRIFKDAAAHGVKSFAFPTTSLIEGVPDSPYVLSKQHAMDWLLKQDSGIGIIPLQFYNVTGAYAGFSEIRQLEVHILPIMLECFMNSKPFIVNGNDYDTIDGTPGRDFSNVRDVAEVILALTAQQLGPVPFKTSQVIKLGTGVTTTAKQMISMFNDFIFPKTGRKLEYEIGPRRAFDCGALRCDQPYLHMYTTPTLVKNSMHQELVTILDKVYNVRYA